MKKGEVDTFCPASQAEWREWLDKNHASEQSVWLVCFKKNSNKATISWSDAVDQALCFGWIDSKRVSIDSETFMQFFSKRKLKGTWSKVNKEKVRRLIDKRLMTKAGYEVIEIAKKNGSWTILDNVEELKIPQDLETALKHGTVAKRYFLGLSNSVRKAMLQWIALAKRPETRQKRVKEVATLAAKRDRPKQFK